MNNRLFAAKILTLGILISCLVIASSALIAQRSSKTSGIQAKTLKKTSGGIGKLNVNAGLSRGSGEVALENYTGAPLKAIQFFVLATSQTSLRSVLPGSAISDKKQWSCHHMIFPGNPDVSGKRTDTVKVVLFGNGSTVLPFGTSVKLLTLNYQQPEKSGTSADTVNFQVTNIIGALAQGEVASVSSGQENRINLWK